MVDKILRDGLEMLLLHASPAEVLQDWVGNKADRQPTYLNVTEKVQRQMPKRYPDRYSLDDAKGVCKALKDNFRNHNLGVFSLISEFADQALIEREQRPLVKYEEILRWRHAVHPLGTAPFMCAFLARQDKQLHTERRMFSFNPVLSTDNRRLQAMLEQGMAENHFHLTGSTPSFMLSWICLMNDITYRNVEFKEMEMNPLTDSLDCSPRKLYVLVWQAAAIRAFLFARLNGIFLFSSDKDNYNDKDVLKTRISPNMLRLFMSFEQSEECELYTYQLQAEIESLRGLYNIHISNDFAPDYAVRYLAEKEIDKTFDIFSGEYWFLYKMFEAMIEENKQITPYLDLFYSYLLISIRLRSELVQSNKQFGFQNFEEYQNRKSGFLDRSLHFSNALVSIAAMTNLSCSHIKSFEARIVPKVTVNKLSSQIRRTDKIIETAAHNKKRYMKKFYYVLHIPKRRDEFNSDNPTAYVNCRHAYLRKTVHDFANSLICFREGCDSYAGRIKGIDACANEIGCRPEVFAPEYRRLKSHQPMQLASRKDTFSMLNVTYHAGEDFLDVVDGLRAIWESMEFLELTRLDRIGHALVLGIDAEKWYESKQKRIFIPRQDLLDDCAWMMHMLGKYSEIPPQLACELKQICSNQYAAIYQNNMPYREKEFDFNIAAYINSMKLRGDKPSYYKFYQTKPDFVKLLDQSKVLHPFDLRDDNKNSDLYEVRRHNKQAVWLYHHYHYTPKTKETGAEIVEYMVTDLYIKSALELQKIIQKQIAKKGIGIETNPSSNVLIGNFNRYDCHPLVVFNDMNLFDKEYNPLLFVSINTDDQGVFDTCLENEYALMARGLEQMTDSNGEPIVSSAKIYSWLDNIRKMGLDQSFNRNI